MKKLILLLALLLISGVAFAGIFGGRSGVQSGSTPPSIIAVAVTPNSFLGGSGDGTPVGDISVTATGATFNGTLAIGPGGQGGAFRLSSTTLPSKLLVNGTQQVGTYTVNLVPTQAGLTNSGNAFPITITGTAVSAGCTQSSTFLAGTSGLSQGQQDAYKAYICGLVADAVIPTTASMASSGANPYCGNKLDALWVMATANTATANKDLCGHSAYTLVPNGSPNFTANQGYLGVDGSSSVYLDTGFNPATASGDFTQDSAHMSIWSMTNAQSIGGHGAAIGSYDNSLKMSQIMPWYSDGNTYGSINADANAGQVGAAVSDSVGFYAVTRTASNVETLYKGTASLGTNATASQSPLSAPIYILARNGGGSGQDGAGMRIGMASVGAGLSASNITAMQSRGCAYLTALNGFCIPPQSLASITPSSCSFTAGAQNGVVCALTVAMNPASPASTAALTLTGANSGAFHLAGPGCANVSLGTCTIQQSSSSGGTSAGTYTDVSVVATQAGINNSPMTLALTLTGASAGSAPGPAAAAGFTTLAIDYDFTQSNPWSNSNNWLRCNNGSGAANPLLYQGWVGFGGFNWPPCSNIAQRTDPFGSLALNLHMDKATINAMGCEPNCNMLFEIAQTVDSAGNGNRLPDNLYAEVVFLTRTSDTSMEAQVIDAWSYDISGANIEWDGIEYWRGPTAGGTYHNGASGNVFSTNASQNLDQSAYHKAAWRVTTNGSNDGYFCTYLDDAPNGSPPGNCISWNPTTFQATNALPVTVALHMGFTACGGVDLSGPCPNSSVDMWVKSLRVWSCAGVNSGASCFTSSANP